MPQIIPLRPLPAQTVTVNLNNQACTITVSQKSTGMFIDLYVDDSLIIGGVICQNENVIVRDAYLGFSGDLAFVDMQSLGNLLVGADPVYTGLGTQFLLYYFLPSELPAGVA